MFLKMDKIKTGLGEGFRLEELRHKLASRLRLLAITKDELTPAKVEPFKIRLASTEPCYERAARYK